MGWGCGTEAGLEIGVELLKFGIVKLSSVVRDNGLGYAEETYNALPDEGLDSGHCDGRKGFIL